MCQLKFKMGDSSDNVTALKSAVHSGQDLALRDLECYREGLENDFRFANFTLSVSDTESVRTNKTSSHSSFEDLDGVEEGKQSGSRGLWPGALQLSLILGISEDEKAENRLANAAALQSTTGNSAAFSGDNEFEFLRDKNIRKCISLKTNKTPPSTPSKKKAVRFADALGLDLASIRHVIDSDEPPIVPDSAMKNLNLGEEESFESMGMIQVRKLCICFSSPVNSPDFLRRVQERKVLLENCYVDNCKGLVFGQIRVMNLAFHKVVKVRYTMNGWLTHTDILAVYDSGSNDGATDKFSYSIQIPEYFQYGNRMEFSVMYTSSNQTFWDNNYGSNYRIECYIANEPAKLF